MKRLFYIMTLLTVATLTISAQTPSVFERYFAQAQAFTHDFPREKVHLHLDNTSYYQGDTIWYKAYVVTAADNKPTKISKPLYVELVDQLGNVMDRQIIKITNGEGCGQISLSNAFFTGYYEVRAYTKWMLSYDKDPQYFSRTVPIYRKKLNNNESSRSIATYRMDKSMKQRPKDNLNVLNTRFYPEGGNLVRGITSVVGFETLSRDSGWVNVSGFLLSESGEKIAPLATIHDGMGTFFYTPGEKPSKIVLSYKNKEYKFELPEAVPNGYTIQANQRGETIDVKVSRSQQMVNDSVALFIFSQGTPVNYVPITFNNTDTHTIRFATTDIPAGTIRLSLINSNGNTLCDRFCFVYPKDTLHIEGKTDKKLYFPYTKAECKLHVTDATNAPIKNASVSVAIRDGINCDYRDYDNTIFTDLLLTSELKGYINKPGFYFAGNSNSHRKLLDNLMLIRGWRKYNVEEVIGVKTFKPKYLPEPDLTLYGHVSSWFGKTQKDINVTILAQKDSLCISGTTRTDSLGNFSVPLEDFNGKMESIIQTRKDGKQFNRNTTVSLFRAFEPEARPLDFREINPQWDVPSDTLMLNTSIDSLNTAVIYSDVKHLSGITVTAKFKRKGIMQDTEAFERDIIGFYNIRQYVDKQRDNGKFIADDIGYLLHTINNKINIEGTRYSVDSMLYSANGHDITLPFLKGCLDMTETAMLYIDRSRQYAYKFDKNFRVDQTDMTDIFTDTKNDTINLSKLKEIYVRCALQMADRWDVNKDYSPTHGIRRTEIHGYDIPAEFYSPQYTEDMDFIEDHRRTLYWNPNMKTDENGDITINYFNGHDTTFMDVSAETIDNGRPAATNFISYPNP